MKIEEKLTEEGKAKTIKSTTKGFRKTMNKYKKVKCECGCGKEYIKWLNPKKIPKYKIVDCVTHSKKPLTIERLSDNIRFRLGDTVLLVSPNGERKREAKLYDIQVEDNGFMQLHAYPLYTNGVYCIRNEERWLSNAEDPTNFMFLKNITK